VTKEQTPLPHIYELDPLRICTALGVVAVHVLAFTTFLNPGEIGNQLQNAVLVSFHFTREVFMFVTAFALVYVYSRRPIAPMQFWKKRAVGVLFPYAVWSVIYVWASAPSASPATLFQASVFAFLTGNASYQLYYILLTLQFYLFFPLFLPFIRSCARHPWITLAISFTLQVFLFALDYHTIQRSTSPFWQLISVYQDRFFLIYQFYFILGGLSALYFTPVRAFLLRHGRSIVGVFLLALAGLWLHFALQVRVYHESIGYATSVLQPIMVLYSLTVICFALWLASLWTQKRGPELPPRGYRLWRMLADASFGVYLIHALILTVLLRWIVPGLLTTWPGAVRVFLIWVITAGGSVGLSILLMHIPVVSRLVGRSTSQRKKRREPDAPAKSKKELQISFPPMQN
jgi:peptidoglycan/LPS O-acetylase OafA/YrhL